MLIASWISLILDRLIWQNEENTQRGFRNCESVLPLANF